MDKRLPVVAVHGVGSGDNQDRAGFSLDLVRGVHESHRPVHRVGSVPDSAGVLQHVPRRKQKRAILWEEALWESANVGVDQTAGVYIAARFPVQVPVLGAVIDMLTDVPAYYSSFGSQMRTVVRNAIKAHPNCIVVAHSLGSVVSVDVLREAQLKDDFASMPVSGLVTLGSPLTWLRPKEPLAPGGFPFKWYNYYYPQDPIPLGRKLKKSEAPGVKNRSLGSHDGFVVSHTAYWTSTSIANQVRRLSKRGGGK